MNKVVSVLFLFCVCRLFCFGQPICQIQHFSVDDGISQSIVQRIIQDRNGFIWFGTWNGLDRYDGYSFKNYKVSADGENPLTSYRLTYIAEGSMGDIWCQSYDERVFIFDTSKEAFIDVLGPIEEKFKINLFVTKVFPLKKGVTWIACKNGYACRVDEKLLHEGGDGVTLHSTADLLKGESLYGVYMDSDGDEWLLTDRGITVYGKKKIDSDFPFIQVLECGGQIYLVSSSGKLAVYDMETQRLSFLKPSVPSGGKYLKLECLSADTLALSTTDGLLFYLIGEQRYIRVDVGTPGTPSNSIRSVYKDSYGDCWVITRGTGVVRLNLRSFALKTYHIDSSWVAYYERKPTVFFYEDANRTLWILPTDGHLCYYDRQTDSLSYYYKEPGNKASVYNPFVRYFMPDKQGNMWLVLNFGLDKVILLPYNVKFNDIDYGVELRAFMTDNRNRLWVGSKTGIVRLYDDRNRFVGYLSGDGNITQDKVAFSSGIYAVYQDDAGIVWVGTKDDGLYRLSEISGNRFAVSNYRYDKSDEYSLSGNNVVAVLQDSKKRIWVACYETGINLIEKNKNGSLSFINHRNEMKSYPTDIGLKVRCISESTDGVLLVGTTQGLLTFSSEFSEPEEIKFYRNTRRAGDKTSLPANDVMNILRTRKGDLYLFSFTGGMSVPLSGNLLSDSLCFRNYTKEKGLVSELVQSGIEDKAGNIWIIQENALSKFIPEKERFENYRTSLFRTNMKFSEALPVITEDGYLVAGSNCGMFELYVDSIFKSRYVPLLNFTGIYMQGDKKAVLSEDGTLLDVAAEDRNLTFQFAAIDYVNSKDIRYAYRLKGLEEEWNYAEDNRSARYMNIPAGTYEFQVRSTDSDGVWQENTKCLRLVVHPYFRETVWVWMLYASVTVLIIGVIVYILFYIWRLRHNITVEQQLADIKLRFFTDISHELRTPLTLITGPLSEVISHEKLSDKGLSNLQIVEKNARRMLRMMNQILDFRKIQKGKMKIFLERVNVIESLHSVLDSFSSLAFDKHITVSVDTEMTDWYIWTDSDKFDKIFFNLVSNAFKYTPDGKSITVRIRKEGEYAVISVEDQGIGIDDASLKNIFQRFETLNISSSQPSSGIGLSLVKDLVDMLHGTIRVESHVGEGSKFIVSIPTSQNAFREDRRVELLLEDGHAGSEVAVPLPEATVDKDQTEIGQEERTSVLVVEDNAEMRAFLMNILSDEYRVLTAGNGEQGLQAAREELPDIILTDVMMPVMDGLDMIRHLKEDADICHIPIIVLSAKSSLDDRIAALDEGIDDYIAKPFSATYLKARIVQLFKQRKRLQESFLLRLSDKKDAPVKFDPTQPKVMDMDQAFMQKVMAFMEENMDNPELEIDDFAVHLGMSRTLFYRKLKSIVGVTPVEFVREIRIKRAVQLMDASAYNFSQIAYMTGFTDPKYFGKCFKKIMGVTPSQYKVNKKE